MILAPWGLSVSMYPCNVGTCLSLDGLFSSGNETIHYSHLLPYIRQVMKNHSLYIIYIPRERTIILERECLSFFLKPSTSLKSSNLAKVRYQAFKNLYSKQVRTFLLPFRPCTLE